MTSRTPYRWLLSVMVLSFVVLPVKAEDNKPADGYRTMIDERAARALKNKDVAALVECAFALYPLETTARAKDPRYRELLARAADLVLESNGAAGAAVFLETAGPLMASLKAEQRNRLETLARGRSIEEIATRQADAARGVTNAVTRTLADPEAKPRGDDLRQAAEGLGKGLVKTVRSAETLTLKKYSFRAVTLAVTMEWTGARGAWTYTSQIEIDFETDGKKLKITNIYYADDAPAGPNRAGIAKFQRQFNAK